MPTINNGGYTPSPIVSPGVFTKENDLSGLAQGVAEIGAVIVAPFPKGPGFTPVIVESVADLESQFGVADGVYYGPYTAKEYLIEKMFRDARTGMIEDGCNDALAIRAAEFL